MAERDLAQGIGANRRTPNGITDQQAVPTDPAEQQLVMTSHKRKASTTLEQDARERIQEVYARNYNAWILASRLARPRFKLLDALCENPDIMNILLTKYLNPAEMLKLFTVSRAVNRVINRNLGDIVSSSVSHWWKLEPNALLMKQCASTRIPHPMQLFPLRAYYRMLLSKSNHHQNHSQHLQLKLSNVSLQVAAPGFRGIGEKRDPHPPPGLRYLSFLYHRFGVINSIIRSLLHDHGLRLPYESSLALCKLWSLMDVPFNTTRLTLIQNTKFWTDSDLYFITMFLIKLDMCMTDPVDGLGKTPFRRLLMAQKSLTTLALVLRGEKGRNTADLIKMYTKWKNTTKLNYVAPLLGIPDEEVGSLSKEGWNQIWEQPELPALGPSLGYAISEPAKLMPLDQFIVREGVKRNLGLHHFYKDMMMSGYVDHIAQSSIKTPATHSDLAMARLKHLLLVKDHVFGVPPEKERKGKARRTH